jgi:hypothetical protein
MLLSAWIMVKDFKGKSDSRISRKLLLSFSDQQIMTGIGIQSVGLAKLSTIVPYHFFIIWMLSLLSTATHLSTLLALVKDFQRDWVLRWLRRFLMLVNLVLSCVYGIFILNTVTKGLKPTLPIACVGQVSSNGANSNVALSFVGTVAVISGNCIVFALALWYTHNSKWAKLAQAVGFVILVAAGIGAAVRVISLSQAFGTPSVPLSDMTETEWSFGQLLPLLLLLLPLVSVVEISRGIYHLFSSINGCLLIFSKAKCKFPHAVEAVARLSMCNTRFEGIISISQAWMEIKL